MQIAAFDEEGNLFNGLDGFRFDWNVEEGRDNVKVVSLQVAAHASASRFQKEFDHMQTDVLFLKGLKQGQSIVSARLLEPGYEEVSLSQITLTISEPFIISPS